MCVYLGRHLNICNSVQVELPIKLCAVTINVFFSKLWTKRKLKKEKIIRKRETKEGKGVDEQEW